MELVGQDAVKYLAGFGSVRDGVLISLTVGSLDTEPVIELVFNAPRKGAGNSRGRIVTIELREIREFQYSYDRRDRQQDIALVKCLMTDEGDFFLSLDPYDEREAFVSDKDNDSFRSRFVKVAVYEAG
jgi:hypothetical protein